MMNRWLCAGAFAAVLSPFLEATAQDAALPAPAVVDLAPLSVGVKSPPLWLFSRGGKQLVILGTQLPVPESAVIITRSIEDYVGQAGAVLTGPGLRTGDGVGFMRGLTLVSGMRKAQRNAVGRALEEVLPAETYADWQSHKSRYIGRDSGVERMRPMYAAYELYTAALKQNGLTDTPVLGGIIEKASRAAGLRRIDARYSLPNDNLRQTLRSFEVPESEDLACLQNTLSHIDAYISSSPAAAEAWAAGDMRRYRVAEMSYTPIETCWARLTNEAISRSGGVSDPYERMSSTWLAAVFEALEAHEVVFSTLPTRDLVQGTGLAAELREAGFTASELFSE